MLKYQHIGTILSSIAVAAVVYHHGSNASVSDSVGDSKVSLIDIAIPEQKNTKTINANTFVKWHLFGQETIAKKPGKTPKIEELVVDDLENLPVTKINIEVSGVFSQQKETGGYAIITGSDGKEKSYQVGEEIQKNVTLHSIYKGHVVLRNNNRLEKLNLPEMKTQGRKPQLPARFANRNNLKSFAARNPKNNDS